jgi:hypothetical protein
VNPKEKLAALRAEAADLTTKAKAGTLTAEESDRAVKCVEEIGATQEVIAKQASAAAALAGLGGGTDGGDPAPVQKNDDGVVLSGTIGERFVGSEAYKSFMAANPNMGVNDGSGQGTPIAITAKNIGPSKMVRKAALDTVATGNARAVRTNEVIDQVFRPERTLLDLITRGRTNLPWFQYRQVVTKTNNAAIVAEAANTAGTGTTGGVKPLSTLTTNTAEAKAFTYADGVEVTNQELSDDGIISALIDSLLTENLDIKIEDIILNGAGTADEPAGILNTSGVLQQAFVTDVPTTLRKAITKLRTTSGANIQAVVLNPTDDEAWDLLKDTTGRYLGNGPFGTGPRTAWGFERIASQKITAGQALVGDFRQVQLLILEALSILAFNQHKDYAQRNLTYVRAELRAVQLIRQPAKLCVVDLTA